MGCLFSKTSGKSGDNINRSRSSSSRRHGGSSTGPSSNSQTTTDLPSYEAACQVDPVVQHYDAAFKDRVSRVIATLATDIDLRSLSRASFQRVTECLEETNQEVVQFILKNKTDLRENQDLFGLIDEYFESSMLTVGFCNTLEKCIERARDSHGIAQVAIQQFDQERGEGIDYDKTILELRNLKASCYPFREVCSPLNKLFHKHQKSILKLRDERGKLVKEQEGIETRKTVTNVIFGATFAAVLICSAVVAAIAAPPVVVALSTVASGLPLGSIGMWLNWRWKKYEEKLKQDKEIVTSIKNETHLTIHDLQTIKALVEKLGNHMNDLAKAADFAITEKEEAVVFAMDDIRKVMSEFEQTVNNLGDRADKFRVSINTARTEIMQKVITHHGSS